MPDRYRAFSENGYCGEVLEEFQNDIALGHLEEWFRDNTTRVVRELPMRGIYFCQREQKPDWHFKLLRGLGDQESSFLQSLKWRFRPSRFLRVLAISQELQRAGFLCPRVILAARKRPSLFGNPTDFIILETARGRMVVDYLAGGDGLARLEGEARRGLLVLMGHELARLHNAGFVHGDCHPGNYFWEEGTEEFCYIDNDRTSKYNSLNISGAIRNLVSAGFFLLHRDRVTPEEWTIILDAYLQKTHCPLHKIPSFRQRVEESLQKRLRKDL